MSGRAEEGTADLSPAPEKAGPLAASSRRLPPLSLALPVLPLALLAAGRFLPGPRAWGFNHLAYLPGWFYGTWLAAVLLLGVFLTPAVSRPVCERLAIALPRFLFERRWVPWALAVAAGAVFVLLRERSFFMGDGYLVGELVERGVPFRAFDSLDYLLHFQIYQRLGQGGERFSSFDLYRGSAVLAGMLAVVIWLRLIGRLSWSPWRKATLAGLLFGAGSAALFFGYVESYSFLFLFLTAFLICGLAVLEGKAPLWLAATFYGLGLAFHLTALFTAPALLVLAWRAPGLRPARRMFEALGPPALLLLVATLLHIAEGFNAYWFRREFLEAKNTQNIWIPLAGGRGLFSTYHWKDLFNLAMITAPVCLVAVLTSRRQLVARVREPRHLLLLVQIATLAVISVVVDRKLGGARDWDLLTAHSAGLILLAVLLLPGVSPENAAAAGPTSVTPASPGPAKVRPGREGREGGEGRGGRGGPRRRDPRESGTRAARDAFDRPHPMVPLILGVSFLVVAPWIVLLHWEDRSISRFVDVAADFPEFQRAYAYEEVGKYYRKAGQLERAQTLYERAVATNPSHARIRILLGSIYFARDNLDAAEQQYLAASRIDPKSSMAMEALGQVAMQRRRYEDAWKWFTKLLELQPQKATSWEYYGYAASRTGRWEETIRGFRRAKELDPSLDDHRQEIGVALAQLERYDEAAEIFRGLAARPDAAPETRLGLAMLRVEMARRAIRRGEPVPAAWLEEAQRQVDVVLSQQPGDQEAADLRQELQHLRP